MHPKPLCPPETKPRWISGGGAPNRWIRSRIPANNSRDTTTSATATTLGQGRAWHDTKYTRKLDPRAIYATRCRTFHATLSAPALEFMNNQINEWVDTEDGITIKFATSTIGIFEGKHAEPHLILTLFY